MKRYSERLASFQSGLSDASSVVTGMGQSDLLVALRLTMQLQNQLLQAMPSIVVDRRLENIEAKESLTEYENQEAGLDCVALESEIICGSLASSPSAPEAPAINDYPPQFAAKRIKLESLDDRIDDSGFCVAELANQDDCDLLIVDPEDGGFIIPGFTVVNEKYSMLGGRQQYRRSHHTSVSSSALSSLSPLSANSLSINHQPQTPLPPPSALSRLMGGSSRLVSALKKAAASASSAASGDSCE